MKVNKNDWHYKLVNVYNKDKLPRNVCGYFEALLISVLKSTAIFFLILFILYGIGVAFYSKMPPIEHVVVQQVLVSIAIGIAVVIVSVVFTFLFAYAFTLISRIVLKKSTKRELIKRHLGSSKMEYL